MPTYGFVIDLKKCIGCHACTIACKSEHDVPLGVNRCWVKTVEKGTFPETQRFFLPVLCNQCEEAPCMKICPTSALYQRHDGIVDLNGDACIGCRACMVACPYDQLFIDPNTRTAEKCNFCANRVENHLEPACVSVCPTECRIFGDLDDATSEVAHIVQRDAFMVRKPEKGTGPKVFYLGADEAAIRPEIAARPFMFKEGQVHLRPLGAVDQDPARPGDPPEDRLARVREMPHVVSTHKIMAKLQAMAVACDLKFDGKKTNPNGGAVGLGHPIGATGALVTVKALYELQRTGGKYALVTMCIGGGQGIAAIFERM